LSTYANDSLLHGSYGNVTQILWSNGATITINTGANSTVKAAVYKNGVSNTGNTNIMVAYARYGLGKVVAFGDSSPFDDGTGDTNDQLYGGYISNAAGNHQKIIMNATVWLATSTPLPVTLSNFTCKQQQENITLNWQTATEINTSYFNVQRSIDGNNFETIGKINISNSNYLFIDNCSQINLINKPLEIFYRLEIIDKDGSKTYSIVKRLLINDNHQQIDIYPNPAQNEIHIVNNNAVEILIYNSVGTIIQRLKTDSRYQTINISQFLSGLYFIKTKFKNGYINNQKFIKL